MAFYLGLFFRGREAVNFNLLKLDNFVIALEEFRVIIVTP